MPTMSCDRDDLPIDIHRGDLTIDDVAVLPEDFYYELLDGRIYEQPSRLAAHQMILMDVVLALEPRAHRPWISAHSVSIAIGRHDEPRPDFSVAHQRWGLTSPVPVSGVILVGEVLSAASEPVDRGYKMDLYARGGIQHYWIIDPLFERVTLTQYLLGPEGTYREKLTTDDVVTLDEPWPVVIDLPAMTLERDRIHPASHPYR